MYGGCSLTTIDGGGLVIRATFFHIDILEPCD